MNEKATKSPLQTARSEYMERRLFDGADVSEFQDWDRIDAELSQQIFGETQRDMMSVLQTLDLPEASARDLVSVAAYFVHGEQAVMERLKVPPSDQRRELQALADALRRAQSSLHFMGDPGKHRLAEGLPVTADSGVAFYTRIARLEQFMGELATFEVAAREASRDRPEYSWPPEGRSQIASARQVNLATFLADLDCAFEHYAGRRPPRSEYTPGDTAYPWFTFSKLAAAPLGAPQSNVGFRRLFRLTVKIA